MKDYKEKESRSIVTKISLEKREDNTESRKISGYAAVFNEWSNPLGWFREMIRPGAFDNADFSNCILCFNHNNERLLARTSSGTLTLKTDDKGLYFEAELPNTTDGNDVLEMVKRGDIDSCSFCFIVNETLWREAPEGSDLEEREIVSVSEVYDVSPVIYPAYSQTSVAVRSLEQERDSFLKKDNTVAEIESQSRYRTIEVLRRKNI